MNQASSTSNLAGRQLGRYEVLTQLAAGGMAGVYVARALGVAGFERLVAIKVLHPHLAYEDEFISMFLDEARLAARIRHPNVVPTLDISDSDGDGFFLVMDYIEGDHLGAVLTTAAKAGQRIPAPVTVRIMLDALAGLSAAHVLADENGESLELVHRDVSPHNIMVGIDGIARLTDFGVAKAQKRLSSTREGQFKGKLAYMAPEQASIGDADQRSDLFSMATVLWESLVAQRLFRGENNAATLNKVLHGKIPLPSDLWSELAAYDEVLRKALDRNPDERFQTADAFAKALEDAAREHKGIATQREVGEVVKEWTQVKLSEERTRLKASIDRLGRSDFSSETHLPLPREGSSSRSGSRSVPIPVSGSVSLSRHDLTLPSRPSSMAPTEESSKPWALLLSAGALIGLLSIVVITWLLMREPEKTVTPLPVRPIETQPIKAAPGAHTEPQKEELGIDGPKKSEETENAETDPTPGDVEPEPTVVRSDEPTRRARGMRRRNKVTPIVMEEAMKAEPKMLETRSDSEDDLARNPYRR